MFAINTVFILSSLSVPHVTEDQTTMDSNGAASSSLPDTIDELVQQRQQTLIPQHALITRLLLSLLNLCTPVSTQHRVQARQRIAAVSFCF